MIIVQLIQQFILSNCMNTNQNYDELFTTTIGTSFLLQLHMFLNENIADTNVRQISKY